jgi:hypothetical protein
MGVGGVVLLVRDSVLCPLDGAVSIVYASLLTLCAMLLQLTCPLKKNKVYVVLQYALILRSLRALLPTERWRPSPLSRCQHLSRRIPAVILAALNALVVVFVGGRAVGRCAGVISAVQGAALEVAVSAVKVSDSASHPGSKSMRHCVKSLSSSELW